VHRTVTHGKRFVAAARYFLEPEPHEIQRRNDRVTQDRPNRRVLGEHVQTRHLWCERSPLCYPPQARSPLPKKLTQLADACGQKAPTVFVGVLRKHAGDTQQDLPARLQNAVNLRKHKARVRGILQHLSAQNQIKLLAGKWNPLRIRKPR
jgi:hypothetical protein